MDSDIDNRNNPSYLSHYGMYRPPFMTVLEDDMYYPEPTRTQRLDILLHLAQYGNELLLVTGPDGCGKTTMLHQFLKKASSEWKICQIDAHNLLNNEKLIQRISSGFNFPEEKADVTTSLRNLKRRLEAMLSNHPTIVIVVDNAQLLTTDVLDMLLDFSNIRNISKGTSVRIMLFSEPQIKIHLAAPELQSKQTMAIRKIDLPALDEQQTGRLIRHRVTTAGLSSKSVFNDSIVNKIYKYSEGWPGAITEIAHQVLFESTPLKRRDTPNNKSNSSASAGKKNIGLVVAAVLVASVLVAALVYQKQINALFDGKTQHTTTKTAEPTRQMQTLVLPNQPPLNSVAEKLTDSDEQEFPKLDSIDEPAQEIIELPEQQSPITVAGNSKPAKPAKPATSTTPTTSISDSRKPTNINKKKTTQAPSRPPLIVLKKTPTGTKTSNYQDEKRVPQPETISTRTQNPQTISPVPLEKQDDWVLAQNPDYFTLQILAGYQQSTMVKFVKQHNLPEADLAYFFSLNRGKNWHSLVFGLFPSYAQASGAAKQLSQQIDGIKPWIRPLRSIQNDILYARDRASP